MKENKIVKKVIPSVLATNLLLLSVPSIIWAKSNTQKEEIIYANLEATGTLKSMYVVNAFDLEESGEIIDYGNYTKITNLSNTNEIKQEEGKISVNADKGRFYYQGDIEQKQLPWKIKITYRLNGSEISPSELAGKEGKLEIVLSFKKNPEVDACFFENYTLQATVTLDEDKAKEIVAQGATIANVGNTKSLTYMVLAGNEKDYTITTQVKDFTMEGIKINGIALALEIDSPDTSEFTEKITTLQDAIQELNQGATSLNTGVSKLNQGANSLKNGSESLKKGVDTLDQGAGELAKGSKELTSAGNQIKEGLDRVNDKSSTLQDSSKQIKTGIDTMASSVNAMKQQIPENATSQVTTLTKASKTYLDQLNSLIASLPEGKEQERIKALRDNYIAINTGVQTMGTITKNCISGTTQLANSLTTLKEKYAEFDRGIDQYTVAVSTIREGYQSLYTGIQKVDHGVEVLKNGTVQLKKGSYELYTGSSELTTGTKELLTGTQEMKQGTEKMKDETKNVDSEISDTVDRLMNEYTKSDFTVKSFVSSDNEKVKAIQFVLQTEGIEKEEEVKEEVKETKQESFWDKIVGLFQ